MANLKALNVGDVVSVCVGNGTYGAQRWRQEKIVKVTKTYAEIESGNRFDLRTGKETKGPICGSPEYSSVFIDDDNEYWDAAEAEKQHRIKCLRLWSELESNARNQNIVKCIDIVSDLAGLLLAQPNTGS